jgi:hypothetical protein
MYLYDPKNNFRRWSKKKELKNMKFETLGIGKEFPPLSAKKVKIEGIEEKEVKEFGLKLILKVKHPDVENHLEVSRVKYQLGDKLNESGLWLTKDKEGNIPFNSAVAHLLRFCECKIINGLLGKEIDTIVGEKGFLIIKAY